MVFRGSCEISVFRYFVIFADLFLQMSFLAEESIPLKSVQLNP